MRKAFAWVFSFVVDLAMVSACVVDDDEPDLASTESPILVDGVAIPTFFGMCLGIEADDLNNGSRIVLQPCSNSVTQRWSFSLFGIIYTAGNRCIDVYDFQTTDGSAVVSWECNGLPNQSWTLLPDGRIRGLAEKCLTAASWVANAPVYLAACDVADQRQVFWPSRLTQLRSEVDDRCWTSTAIGNHVFTHHCHFARSFEFTANGGAIVRDLGGCVEAEPAPSPVPIPFPLLYSGSQVRTGACNGRWNQRWTYEYTTSRIRTRDFFHDWCIQREAYGIMKMRPCSADPGQRWMHTPPIN